MRIARKMGGAGGFATESEWGGGPVSHETGHGGGGGYGGRHEKTPAWWPGF